MKKEENQNNKSRLKTLGIFLAVLTLLFSVALVGPPASLDEFPLWMTGLASKGNIYRHYLDDVDITANQNMAQDWSIVTHPDQFYLRGFTITGSVSGNGKATVKLFDGKNTYTIMERQDFNGITFNSIGSITGSLVHDYDKNQNGIDINLEYKSGTTWDTDDDGVSDMNDAVDLTVENTVFSENLSDSGLCTIWEEMNNLDLTVKETCYGSKICCNFAGLYPEREAWDIPFYITSAEGIDMNVSAQVMYIEYSLDPEDPHKKTLYSNVKSLPVSFIPVATISSLQFVDMGLETRIIEKGLDAVDYKLIFEVDNGTVIHIDKIEYYLEDVSQSDNTYYKVIKDSDVYDFVFERVRIKDGNLEVKFSTDSIRKVPIKIIGNMDYRIDREDTWKDRTAELTVKDWSNQYFLIVLGDGEAVAAFGKAKSVELPMVIEDARSNTWTSEINLYNSLNGEWEYEFEPKEGEKVNSTINEGWYNAIIRLSDAPVRYIELKDIAINENVNKFIGLDELPMISASINGMVRAYAFDSRGIDFSTGILKTTAKAKHIYQCKEWNFEKRECTGLWMKQLTIQSGSNYELELSTDNSAFVEADGDIDYNIKDPTILIPEFFQAVDLNAESVDSTLEDASGKEVPVTMEFLGKRGKLLNKKIKKRIRERIKEGKHKNLMVGERYQVKIKPKRHPIKEIKFDDIDISQEVTDLGIDKPKDKQGFKELYAIDPTALNFTNATVTVTATGTTLYKCKEWDFDSQSCNGEWVFFKAIEPGQNYTFILTPADPAFGEGNEIQIRVNQGSDDAEELRSDGDITLSSSDLEMVNDNDWHGGNQDIGIRFQNINIPSGSKINSAYIIFQIDEAESQTTNLNIYGQAADSPGTFTSTDYDISNRAKTTAVVNWNNLPNLAVNSNLQTPDLSTVVQEIVNRTGWDANNDIAFIITGSGRRTVESYNGESANAPLLVINFSEEINDTPINDTENPVIQSVSDTPDPVYQGYSVYITADITDNTGIASAWVNILGTDYPMSCTGVGASNIKWVEDFASNSDWSPWKSSGSGIAYVNSASNCINDANDDCMNAHQGPSATTINKQSDIDLSNCVAGTAWFYISKVKEAGNLESNDCIEAHFSGNSGSTWSGDNNIFCNDNPASTKNISIPDAYLTSNFRIQIEEENFEGGQEHAWLDGFMVGCETPGIGGGMCTLIHPTAGENGTVPYTVYATDLGGNNATPVGGDYTVIIPEAPNVDLDKSIMFDHVNNKTAINLTITTEGEFGQLTVSEIDVMMLIDRSGSMNDDGLDPGPGPCTGEDQPLCDAKEGAKSFVDALNETLQRSGLVSFAGSASLDQSLTYTRSSVKSSIDTLTAGGSTAMGSAMNTATTHLVSNGRGTPTRWYQILLTDGANTAGADPIAAANNAAANDIVVFTIGLGSGVTPGVLQQIANITGGQYYYAPTSGDLEDIYELIGEQILSVVAGGTILVDNFFSDAIQIDPPLPAGCTNTSQNGTPGIYCDIGDVGLNETITIKFNVTLDPNEASINTTYLNKNAYINYTDYLGNPITQMFNNPPFSICEDNDGDGYYVSTIPWLEFVCGPTDCDDTNASIYPGATELCNNIDDDCDGIIDDGFENDTCDKTCENNGFNWTGNGGNLNCCGDDPNEDNPFEWPIEITCDDTNDNDCDGLIDGADPDCHFCTDNDGDGYNQSKAGCGTPDCDDTNASINPGATEICNGVDDDCDTIIDGMTQSCGLGACSGGNQTCTAGVWGDCSTYNTDCGVCAICNETGVCVDDLTQDTDCDSNDLPEVASCFNVPDGINFTWDFGANFNSQCSGVNNCTSMTYNYTHECDITQCGAECEYDSDCSDTECDGSDGCYAGTYRDYNDTVNNCTDSCACTNLTCVDYDTNITDNDGDGYDIECDGDCNDTNASINPGATEICNGVDDDCDGTIDEGFENDTCQPTCVSNGFNWTGNGGQLNCCGDDSGEDNPFQVPELNCSDSNDNDCDGDVDCNDTDCNGVVVCDNDAPFVNITAPPSGTMTNDTTPEISFVIIDDFDTVLDYVIYINGTPDGTGTANNGTVKTVDLPTLVDGVYNITVQGTDDAGNSANATTSIIITIDSHPLNIVILNPLSQWYRWNFTVMANVSNGFATPDTVKFRYENATFNSSYVEMNYTGPYYESFFNIFPVPDGNYTFRIWANDTAGNIAIDTVIDVGIDDTKPNTTDDAPTTWQNANFNFDLTCADATSGCAAIYYSLDGNPYTPDNDNPAEVTINTEGDHALRYYSVDNAGNNEFNNTIRKYVKLDKTDPVTTNNYSDTGWQTSNIVFNLTCDDGILSGCNETWYCIDTTNTCNPFTGIKYNAPVTHTTQGVYYVRFASNDIAGNDEVVQSQILKVDKTAPIAPVLSDPGTVTANNWVDLDWTAASDSTSGIDHYEVWVSTNNINFTKESGNLANTILTFNDTGLSNNKTYYYYIKAYNGAGDASNSNTESILVDTDKPGVDIIEPETNDIFNVSTIKVEANYSDNGVVTCEVRNNGVWKDMNGDGATSGTADYTFTGLADGYYNFTVRCIDTASNTGTDTVYNILVDTNNLNNSVLINNGALFTNTQSVTLNLNYTDTGSGVKDCRYSNDNSVWSAWTTCTQTKSWTLSSGDGLKTVYYMTRDNALNTITSTDKITLDSNSLDVTITDPLNGAVVNDTTPEITFTMSDDYADNISYVMYVDGIIDASGVGSNPDTIKINTSTLLEFPHTITVVVTDNAGNTDNDTINISIAPQAPVVIINAPPDGTTTSDTTPQITFTITDNTDNYLDYNITLDGVPLIGGTGNAQYGVAQYKTLPTLTQGPHTIFIQAVDDSGNVGNSTLHVIIIDTTPPTVVINDPSSGTTTTDTTPEINFTVTDNLDSNPDYVIFIDGVADGSGTVANNTKKARDLPTLTNGPHTVIVQGTDNAGLSTNSTPITIIVVNCTDNDGDGYNQSDEFEVCGDPDCDDNNASIYPGATELCNDVDDDCDGLIDEDFVNDTCDKICIDNGFNWTGNSGNLSCCGDDPNEDSPFEWPSEITCNDTNDNDCDGLIDLADPDCGGCGNGVINTGEKCDDPDLNNKTCAKFGFKGGDLACYSNCTFDKSDCYKGGGGEGKRDSGELDEPDEECNEAWDCDDNWGECINGLQKKKCRYTGDCPGFRPDSVETKDCLLNKSMMIAIMDYPPSLEVTDEGFSVTVKVDNTGDMTLEGVKVETKHPKGWSSETLNLGNIGVGMGRTAKIKFKNELCSGGSMIIPSLMDVTFTAEEKDVSATDKISLGLDVPELSVLTDKLRYYEADVMRVCMIYNNLGNSDTDKIEFEFNLIYGTEGRSEYYIVDYFSPYSVGSDEILLVAKDISLNKIPASTNYMVDLKMFDKGSLFSPKYLVAEAENWIFMTGMEEKVNEKVGDDYEFMLDDEQHKVTIDATGEDYVVFTIESTPKTFRLRLLESTYVDLDDDNIDDVSVTFMGMSAGKADLRIRMLPTRTAIVTEETLVDQRPSSPVVEEPTIIEESAGLRQTKLVNETFAKGKRGSSALVTLFRIVIAGLVIFMIIVLVSIFFNISGSHHEFKQKMEEEERKRAKKEMKKKQHQHKKKSKGSSIIKKKKKR